MLDELIQNQSAEGLFACLEIIGMYSFKKNLDPLLIQKVKSITSSSIIFNNDIELGVSQDFHFIQLIEKIISQNCMDDDYVTNLMSRVLQIIRESCSTYSVNVREIYFKVLCLLIKRFPHIVWEQLSSFYDSATNIQLDRPLDFLAPNIITAHTDFVHVKSGILFQIMQDEVIKDECLDWAKENPERNGAFLCSFYPVLEIEKFKEGDKDNYKVKGWHPKFIELVEEFGQYDTFITQLDQRIEPSSWMDSPIPYIDIFIEPLSEWSEEHPIPKIRNWSRERLREIQRYIQNWNNNSY
ncbi:MAG: hypothetical protein HC796_06040 [Synechococcaceae cyanobacterium RL_1_2]|nr:hypothetical protein [Synechococcaceae cyanobacterium RL_1_2]